MSDTELLEAVKFSMKERGDKIVPDYFILEAISQINSGKADVPRYPMGAPTMIGVYQLACKLKIAAKN